jgi:hypothetical protein
MSPSWSRLVADGLQRADLEALYSPRPALEAKPALDPMLMIRPAF